ncbi:oligoendopeptidase F [Carnobacterium maltaromaticum]|uniref:oligoendopeptidase F n=1 Tax=Carnobacterium maltaromaticum TaxID=2751 RepID=UPI000C75C835|nr:oligoendopeptidase F [Carnobacterium maltaromaticum]PLS34061.1 oligoendopeptidase F [Carnobacterium maltaromaticum]PLS34196.1 oligoendopeptidase F [Carnobacterium maltaromaticum]PLS34332.1 oligoendopeptidase F [Carnobacterium maltaromaticum]PLS41660.1 oligoendopeptidase F [Carnobacterium maltaromaticum]PLS43142.1 oligoendopeptidase F [Carnobacterium maltaromaticum]
MAETKKLPTRAEIPEELTWDLEVIFKSDAEFNQSYQELEEKLTKVDSVKGKIGQSSEDLLKGIDYLLDISNQLETIYVYAHLKNDQDTTNSEYQAMYDRANNLATKSSEAISWFEPEVLEIPEETLAKFFQENKKLDIYRHFIDQMTSSRAHILSANEEALLAGAGEIFGASSRTFSVLNNADIQFPVIKDEEGNDIQLTHGVYGQLMESTNREVREAAFKNLYKTYEGLKNTFASTLSAHVKYHNYNADVHHYSSARAKALAANHIPEAVYDTLLEVVTENLPLLHRYVALRKELLDVEELHMYDLYTPITGEATVSYTYEEAKAETLKALAPLGEEYLSIVEEAFENRWVDVVENSGKRSGAYSSGAYETNPYILMNWNDTLNQLFTLVHEMGHSVHSYYTRKNQPYVYGDYSIFLAEIASTTNENLLTEYLLETQTDPKIRAYVLNHYLDGFKGTIFRQTQFAEFEHFIHEKAAAGVPLTTEFMSDYYGELNARYYGPDVVEDPEIAIEWTRIPHFYYNYYVYQYATGFSAASALAAKILAGEEHALEHYLDYLKSGSSNFPIEVMKKAGVDMTEKDYITDAMHVFEARLNEFETLIAELKA